MEGDLLFVDTALWSVVCTFGICYKSISDLVVIPPPFPQDNVVHRHRVVQAVGLGQHPKLGWWATQSPPKPQERGGPEEEPGVDADRLLHRVLLVMC